ncbi:MAG: sulfatase family protein, partial [Planctomycetota bacterium]
NPKAKYATPDMHRFDQWFSTEYAVATWDPYDPEKIHGKGEFDKRSLYWHNGRNVTEDLKGDDSRIIMDKAIPFIETAAQNDKPFLAVIWFHAPHQPVIAGAEYKAMYAQYDDGQQHYFGCITALDEQMGRLRAKLRQLGIEKDTMLWFCSDNGPEGKNGDLGRTRGSAGPFRGRKRSLFEGGVRVPAILEWPGKVKPETVTDIPCCTSDYFPTTMDILNFKMIGQPEPIDGVSLKTLIKGKMKSRPTPIGFESRKQIALTDNRYKLISRSVKERYMLFDLINDPGETTDISEQEPDIADKMKVTLEKWRRSCEKSLMGNDYKRKD